MGNLIIERGGYKDFNQKRFILNFGALFVKLEFKASMRGMEWNKWIYNKRMKSKTYYNEVEE